jgi:hypothetical protein
MPIPGPPLPVPPVVLDTGSAWSLHTPPVWVHMTYPGLPGGAWVTGDSFTTVWAPAGWLLTPEPLPR